MKECRFVASLLIVAILLLQLQQSIYAQVRTESSSTGTVPVSYTPDSRYSLSVHVSGQGVIIDGSQSIRNGVVQYDFLTPSQKQFYIQPDLGYQLKLLNYEKDGIMRSVIEEVVNSFITIEIDTTSSVLYVEFERITTPSNPLPPDGVDYPSNPEQGDINSGSENINTGDNTGQWYIWTGLIAIAGLIFLKSKSGKDVCNDTYKR